MKKIITLVVLMGFIATPFAAGAETGSGAYYSQLKNLFTQVKELQAKINKNTGIVPGVTVTTTSAVDVAPADVDIVPVPNVTPYDVAPTDVDDSDDHDDEDQDDEDETGVPVIQKVWSKAGEYKAVAGKSVTITGKNLAGDHKKTTAVYFGGAKAQIKKMKNDVITVTMPKVVSNGKYHVVVINENGRSNQVVVTVGGINNPTIKITSPERGTVWEAGGTYTIKWKTDGDIKTKTVYLEGTTGAERGMDNYLGETTANEFTFMVDPDETPAGVYTLWVSDKNCSYINRCVYAANIAVEITDDPQGVADLATISPDEVEAGVFTQVTVTGRNFGNQPVVNIKNLTTGHERQVMPIRSYSNWIRFNVPSNLLPGSYDISTYPSGYPASKSNTLRLVLE